MADYVSCGPGQHFVEKNPTYPSISHQASRLSPIKTISTLKWLNVFPHHQWFKGHLQPSHVIKRILYTEVNNGLALLQCIEMLKWWVTQQFNNDLQTKQRSICLLVFIFNYTDRALNKHILQTVLRLLHSSSKSICWLGKWSCRRHQCQLKASNPRRSWKAGTVLTPSESLLSVLHSHYILPNTSFFVLEGRLKRV